MEKLEINKSDMNILAKEILFKLKSNRKSGKKLKHEDDLSLDSWDNFQEDFLSLERKKMAQKDFLKETEDEEFSPRLSRLDFLEQRINRRQGSVLPEDFNFGFEKENPPKNSLADKEFLGKSGLPEELSNIYSRDARRYDTPFEQY